MTRTDLIYIVSRDLKMPPPVAEQFVRAFFDTLTEGLTKGERIELRDFGSFTVRKYKAYEGVNPHTGEKINVAPKRLPHWKTSAALAKMVDRKP